MKRICLALAAVMALGGEVIAYYAYAIDNDIVDGPKMAKSNIHFLTVYDEEQYDAPQSPDQPPKPTPESVRQLDKMIDVQKKLLKETFRMARLRDKDHEDAPKKKGAEGWNEVKRQQQRAAKTAKSQRALKKKLDELMAEVKEELRRLAEGERPEPKPGEGPVPAEPPLTEKELQHMANAAGKMENAAGKLDKNTPAPA